MSVSALILAVVPMMKRLFLTVSLLFPIGHALYGPSVASSYGMAQACRKYVCFLCLVFSIGLSPINQGYGQVALTSLTGAGSSVTASFDDFTGAGFSPTPSAGQLNSNEFRVRGLSAGNMSWGDTATNGDFARGTSAGGASQGGIYAFDVDNTAGVDRALGVQANNNDFTAGRLEWRVQNNTGTTLTEIDIAYDIYVNNDQDRQSELTFRFVDDNGQTLVSSLDYFTPTTADANGWDLTSRSARLSINLAPGNFIQFRWRGNDESGSGRRDEIAIDNLSASVVPEPSTYVLIVGLVALVGVILKLRARSLEQRAG